MCPARRRHQNELSVGVRLRKQARLVVHRNGCSLDGLFGGGVNHRPRRSRGDIGGYLDAAAERDKKRESYRVAPSAHARPNYIYPTKVSGNIPDHARKRLICLSYSAAPYHGLSGRARRYFHHPPVRVLPHVNRPTVSLKNRRGAVGPSRHGGELTIDFVAATESSSFLVWAEHPDYSADNQTPEGDVQRHYPYWQVRAVTRRRE